MVSAFCQTSGANVGTPSDSLGNGYTLLASVGLSPNDQQMFYSFSTTNGQDVISVPIGGCTSTIGTYTYMYTVEVFFGITGIGQTAQNQLGPCGGPTCSNSLAITTQPTSIIYESMGFTAGSNNNNCISAITPNSGQNLLQTDCSQRIAGSSSYASFWKQLSIANPTMTVTYTSNSASSSNQHILAELLTTTATQAFVSQCYGECGNPPISLVNTNATHTINFNNSVTIFYEFQSNLNGILQNVTVNIAKSYSSGQQFALGAWTASCPAGTSPFNIQCAGTLQPGSILSPFNIAKNTRFSIAPQIQVVTGEWIAIGVSGVFSGADLNETNGACGDGTSGICTNGMQWTKGFIPQTISSSSSCTTTGAPCNTAGISSTGMWSWIQGNIIIGTTPPPPSTGCQNSDLACFEFNSICALAPSNCFFAGVIYLFIYFAVFVTFVNLGVFWVKKETDIEFQVHPATYPLAWMGLSAAFTGIGVLPIWFMILEIMIVTILFVGIVRATTGVGES